MEAEIYISRIGSHEGCREDYVSLLPPNHGLIGASIIGMFPAPESGAPVISQQTFKRNGVFVDLMHKVIKSVVPRLNEYLAEATSVGSGSIYVIDRRAAEDSIIQPEDTFGVFEVRNYLIIPDSYEANPTHQLLSKRGFFQLEEELHAALMQEFVAMKPA